VGWQHTLVIFAAIVLAIMPLALALATPRAEASRGPVAHQPVGHALSEALGHRSYVLLVTGYFACGFQLFFITVHLPAYLVDRGLSADVGAWTIGVIGLFNIVGSILSGWLSDRMPKRYLLALIYFTRAIAVLAFVSLPISAASTLIFGAVMGFTWLSTVPPTNALIAVMFGTRWLTMLAGLAFFSHQVGGFLGVWLGGVVFERTGSYDAIWWLSILVALLSAIINLPIVEKPVVRAAAQAA
jgi:predicted MFS family arabinose efflux permease